MTDEKPIPSTYIPETVDDVMCILCGAKWQRVQGTDRKFALHTLSCRFFKKDDEFADITLEKLFTGMDEIVADIEERKRAKKT